MRKSVSSVSLKSGRPLSLREKKLAKEQIKIKEAELKRELKM
jgi:hypothetical protein